MTEDDPAPENRPGPLSQRIAAVRTKRTLRGYAAGAWAHAQNRNAFYLLANNVLGAGTGLLFWLLIARLLGVPPNEVGLGYSIIAMGTVVAVVAKGGLDVALVRHVPRTSRRHAGRLFLLSIGWGCLAALLLSGLLLGASRLTHALDAFDALGWLLIAGIALLLVTTWLQDAYFLADGDARHSFHRNLVFSAARLILPFAVLGLLLPQPVALTWALALSLSAVAAMVVARRLPHREGDPVPRAAFARTARRNISGNAAEFVPGLFLAPIVLAMQGADAAAYFGIAWTAASLLFLLSGAICRSALAELVRQPKERQAETLRRGVRQHLVLVLPGAIAVALLSSLILSLFGTDYAREGSLTLTVLAASIIFVAPTYFYLSVLRANERTAALVLYPLAMLLALAILAPLLAARWGIEGVAIAWFAANAPFAVFAVWRLRHLTVVPHDARSTRNPTNPPTETTP